MIFDIEEKQKTNISLLHAVRFVDKAQKNVMQSTIINCFKKAGFTNVAIAETELDPFIDANIQQHQSTVTTHLQIKEPTTFQEFVTFDDDISLSGLYTDADIIASVSTENDEISDNETIAITEEKSVTNNDAKRAVSTLTTYFEGIEKVENNIFTSLNTIENMIDHQYFTSKSQTEITDFFK